MALQFQPPNFGPPPSKKAKMYENLGNAIETLPQLYQQYKIARMKQLLEEKQLAQQIKEFEAGQELKNRQSVAQYGTGVALPNTINELPGMEMTRGETESIGGPLEIPPTPLPAEAQPTPLEQIESMGIQRWNSMPKALSAGTAALINLPTKVSKKDIFTSVPSTKPAPLSPYEETLQKEKAKAQVKAQTELATVRPMVESVLSEISRVQGLNKDSYGGAAGSLLFKTKSKLNRGKDDQTFKNTADVVNTMQAQVAQVLKSTFGGQLSDSERMYLNQIYGALPSMSQTERDIAMTNVKQMISTKLRGAESKYGELIGTDKPNKVIDDPLGIR